ncbi:MAG TPA: diphthine--ammonia ligase [Candidatus Bathyarchaeia archaeon]
MRLIAAWSGGKDSCLALYKSMQQGHKIQNLLTMMQNKRKSNFHMISTDILDAQSQAIGLPITKVPTTPQTYEQHFQNALQEAKNRGAQGILTGDIFDVAHHEAGWLERISANAGLAPVRPLWHKDTAQVFNEFVDEGFKAIIVRTKNSLLDMEYLGKQLDKQFLSEIQKLGAADPCGERGEYHTLVTDGPIFSKRIEILKTKTSTVNGWGNLQITKYNLTQKN